MIEVIPAILTDSSLKFKELVRKLEPYTRRIHIDIADGDFVPNKTVRGYEELREIEASVKFDIHLMVEKPEEHLKEWLHTHADRFIIHAESKSDLAAVIDELHKNRRKVGMALNPETSVDKVEPYLPQTSRSLASGIDFVQFMTVHPGFQGGSFVKEVVDKIAAFHKGNPGIIIMSDGGTTPETVPGLVQAGVSELVSGSYIINSGNIEKTINQIEEAANN
ncbi:MAG: ribulose-phosphate 3-epimerase [Candidatus Taylorbacteria bacterium]|nr:ribulose-phosphate 3-epimerase [Candidatus Taylorbacteria bacterium]